MNEAIELISLSDGTVRYVQCVRCGALNDPRHHGGVDEARRAAENCAACRTDEEARAKVVDAQESRLRRIGKATRVADLGFCFSDRDERCYADPDEAAREGETGVFGSTFRPYEIDAAHVLEQALENHCEDASEHDLQGWSTLAQAIQEFNDRQTTGSYELDQTRWQELPQTRTFGMIKPDATERGVQDAMIADIEAAGLRVTRRETRALTRNEAEWLYDEHRGRDHFEGLVDYTVSGEVVLMLIESENPDTPAAFRRLMGATDRTKAEPHTLRAHYAVGYRENSVHGSDGPRAAVREIDRFFP